jgi:glyoxylase-like metal-dependent hydrolase (beta-lactamase superfamily II)
MQVTKSINRIELNLPFADTPILNVYVIKGRTGSAVIDTGMSDAKSNLTLMKEIDEIGIPRKRVSMIINTHEHIEHFSGNYRLVEATGAKIVAHRIAEDLIEDPTKQIPSDEILRNLPKEAAEMMKQWSSFFKYIKPTKVSRVVEDGNTIKPADDMELTVIHTPGHANGHICLYDKDRKLLFSGDQVLGEGTPWVGKSPFGDGGDMGDYIDSLKKLKALKLDTILPGHGPIVTEPYKRIDETIERKLKREQAILDSLKGVNEKDLLTITKEVYDYPQGEVYYYSSCVLAYLSKLKKEGKVDYKAKGLNITCRLKR